MIQISFGSGNRALGNQIIVDLMAKAIDPWDYEQKPVHDASCFSLRSF